MDRLVMLIGATALSAATAASAGTPCPPHKAGEAYPWEVNQLMSGDQWADLSIDLDAKGKVTGCKVIKGNLESEMGFYICQATARDGEFDPVTKDGVPVAGSRTTHFVLQGMRHRDANAAARKKWFNEHPQERWNCYPE